MFGAIPSEAAVAANAAAASGSSTQPPGIRMPELNPDKLNMYSVPSRHGPAGLPDPIAFVPELSEKDLRDMQHVLRRPEMMDALRKELVEVQKYIDNHARVPDKILTDNYRTVVQTVQNLISHKWVKMDTISEENKEFLKFMLHTYGVMPVHDLISHEDMHEIVWYMIREVLLAQGWKKEHSWLVPIEVDGKELIIPMHPSELDVIDANKAKIIEHFLTEDIDVLLRVKELNHKKRKFLNGHMDTMAASMFSRNCANPLSYLLIKLNESYMTNMADILSIPRDKVAITSNRGILGKPLYENPAVTAHWDLNIAENPLGWAAKKKVQSKTCFNAGAFCGLIGCNEKVVEFLREAGHLPAKGGSFTPLETSTLMGQALKNMCTTMQIPATTLFLWMGLVLHWTQAKRVDIKAHGYRVGEYGWLPVEAGTLEQTLEDVHNTFHHAKFPNHWPNPISNSKPKLLGPLRHKAERYRNYGAGVTRPGWYEEDLAKMDEKFCKETGMIPAQHEVESTGQIVPAWDEPRPNFTPLQWFGQMGLLPLTEWQSKMVGYGAYAPKNDQTPPPKKQKPRANPANPIFTFAGRKTSDTAMLGFLGSGSKRTHSGGGGRKGRDDGDGDGKGKGRDDGNGDGRDDGNGDGKGKGPEYSMWTIACSKCHFLFKKATYSECPNEFYEMQCPECNCKVSALLICGLCSKCTVEDSQTVPTMVPAAAGPAAAGPAAAVSAVENPDPATMLTPSLSDPYVELPGPSWGRSEARKSLSKSVSFQPRADRPGLEHPEKRSSNVLRDERQVLRNERKVLCDERKVLRNKRRQRRRGEEQGAVVPASATAQSNAQTLLDLKKKDENAEISPKPLRQKLKARLVGTSQPGSTSGAPAGHALCDSSDDSDEVCFLTGLTKQEIQEERARKLAKRWKCEECGETSFSDARFCKYCSGAR